MAEPSTPPPPTDSRDRKERDEKRGTPIRSPPRSPRDRERDNRENRDHSPRRSRSPSGGSSINLYVNGLSARTTEEDLKGLFSKYGKITSSKLIRDPRSGACRGFGFIRMDTDEEANQAIRGIDNTEFDGRRITVEKARRAKSRSPTPGRYLGRASRDGGPPRGYGYGSYYPSYPGSYYGGGGGGGRAPSYYGGGGGYRYSPYRDRERRRSRSPYYENRRSRSPYYEERRGRSRSPHGAYRGSPPRARGSRSPPRARSRSPPRR